MSGRFRPFQEWEWAVGLIPVGIHQWIMEGVREREAWCKDMDWIEAPMAGDFFADPCLAQWDDEKWILFEHFEGRRGRGVIAAAQVSGVGALDTRTVITHGSHHLAYPSVFRVEEQWFCIADSSDSVGIPVFKGSGPTMWSHVGYLKGVPRLTDPTIDFDGRMWWLFGLSGRSKYHVQLMRFMAREPLGQWTECSSVAAHDRMRRPAGRLIRFSDGRTLRPAQDCRSDYGDGVCLYEVGNCDRNSYTEMLNQVIVPSKNWKFGEGCHTITGDADLTVVDGFRREPCALAPLRKLRHRLAVRY